MKDKHIIIGVHITDRLRHASEVQKVLTEFGKNIKTRLGLHEVEKNASSPNGILLLEMVGNEEDCLEVAERLNNIEGVETQKMIFSHS